MGICVPSLPASRKINVCVSLTFVTRVRMPLSADGNGRTTGDVFILILLLEKSTLCCLRLGSGLRPVSCSEKVEAVSLSCSLLQSILTIVRTMKCAILASVLTGAAAFAPTQNARTSVATNMAFENEIGAQPPLGFFDPLGLVADGNQAKFDRLRYVELKHGRIAMLAVSGYLTTAAGIRLPGDIDYSGTAFSDLPAGFGSFGAMSGAGAAQIFAFIGILELGIMKDVTGEAEFPGDFRNGFIDFGWDKYDEATKTKKRAIELNQGRAAQMGILGLMMHEQMGVSVLPPSF